MTHAGQWKPGQSGNPSGRPPGAGQLAQLRDAIAEHLPEIVDRLVEQAKSGDAQSARILIERVLPTIRPIELPISLPREGGTLVERADRVLDAVAAGDLAPTQASALLAGLGAIAKLKETEDLQKRIEQLEKAVNKNA